MENERLEKLAKKLRFNGYDVLICNTKEEAKEEIINMCKNKTIGIGDSHTIIDLDVLDNIKEEAKALYAMQIDKSRENKLKSMMVDLFILSANAVAEDTGEMINIDGAGNRVAPSIYGPEEVLFVIGKNKIEKSFIDAYNRVKNYVAPKNSKSHEFKNPCVYTGKCENCNSPTRICRTVVIYQKRSYRTPTKIILVNEDLGW